MVLGVRAHRGRKRGRGALLVMGIEGGGGRSVGGRGEGRRGEEGMVPSVVEEWWEQERRRWPGVSRRRPYPLFLSGRHRTPTPVVDV